MVPRHREDAYTAIVPPRAFGDCARASSARRATAGGRRIASFLATSDLVVDQKVRWKGRGFVDTLLAEHDEGMARWLAYLEATNPDGLWCHARGNDFGDWLALDGDDPSNAFGRRTPKDLLATAYYAHDARLMSRMARTLGRAADAARYEALFDTIKVAFMRPYVSDDGRVAGDTQTGYVFALHMDLLPGNPRAAAADHLVAKIRERDWRLTTGFVGVGYLLPVLTETGHADVAYRLLLNETYPSWGYSIRQGVTTIWERWTAGRPSGASRTLA